jgi:hypothetical protein
MLRVKRSRQLPQSPHWAKLTVWAIGGPGLGTLRNLQRGSDSRHPLGDPGCAAVPRVHQAPVHSQATTSHHERRISLTRTNTPPVSQPDGADAQTLEESFLSNSPPASVLRPRAYCQPVIADRSRNPAVFSFPGSPTHPTPNTQHPWSRSQSCVCGQSPYLLALPAFIPPLLAGSSQGTVRRPRHVE